MKSYLPPLYHPTPNRKTHISNNRTKNIDTTNISSLVSIGACSKSKEINSQSQNSQKLKPLERSRFYFIDNLRILACFSVILIHVSSQLMAKFSSNWEVALFYNCLGRMGVPLFLVITGYLVFSPESCNKTHSIFSIYRFLKHRYLKLLIPFFTTCFIYGWYNQWTIETILHKIVYKQVCYHLWYIYASIGLYLSIPFLRPLFRKENLNSIKIYLIVWFVFQLLFNTAQILLGKTIPLIADFNLNIFFGITGYMILGGFFRNINLNTVSINFDNPNRINTIYVKTSLCISVILLMTALMWYLTNFISLRSGRPNESLLYSLTLFYFIKIIAIYFLFSLHNLSSSFIKYLAKHCYWIYLFHVLAISIISKFFILNENPTVMIPLVSILSFVYSFILAIPFKIIEEKLYSIMNI